MVIGYGLLCCRGINGDLISLTPPYLKSAFIVLLSSSVL